MGPEADDDDSDLETYADKFNEEDYEFPQNKVMFSINDVRVSIYDVQKIWSE